MAFKKDFDDLLCFQTARTHQLFNRFYKTPLNHFHLTYVQYIVLLALWHHDHATVNYLSKHVNLTNGTLTPLLKRLQRDGWITRLRDPNDERRVIIALTPFGKRNKTKVLGSVDSCLSHLGYTKKEYQQTMEIISDIQRRLTQAIKIQTKDPE